MNSWLQDVRGRNWDDRRAKQEEMIHRHPESDYGRVWQYLWPRMLPQWILCSRVVFHTSDNWTKGDGLNGLQRCWLQAGQSRSGGMRTSVSKADSTTSHCSEGSGPRRSLEWKQTLIKDRACKQLFREATSVVRANTTRDGLNTPHVLLVSPQSIFDEASFLLSGNSNYSWMLMGAINFPGHQIIIQLGAPKQMCSPRYKVRGPPRRPVPILPTQLLSFFIRDPNLFHVEADIFHLFIMTIISPQT